MERCLQGKDGRGEGEGEGMAGGWAMKRPLHKERRGGRQSRTDALQKTRKRCSSNRDVRTLSAGAAAGYCCI